LEQKQIIVQHPLSFWMTGFFVRHSFCASKKQSLRGLREELWNRSAASTVAKTEQNM
jgi:hypothetical protein